MFNFSISKTVRHVHETKNAKKNKKPGAEVLIYGLGVSLTFKRKEIEFGKKLLDKLKVWQ